MDWIRQKGLKGRDPKTGKYITNESLAFLISMGIKKYGIKATGFIDYCTKEIQNDEAITNLLEEIVVEEIETQ
jgi:F0F1-type ATP synthase membrane subunit a